VLSVQLYTHIYKAAAVWPDNRDDNLFFFFFFFLLFVCLFREREPIYYA
jgi:hypothetical protein